jgi:run domain Beclin-1 interacting cysteine-rich containing protein
MKINEIKPIEAVKKCDIPVIFIHAKDDEMVNFQHTLDLYNNYRGIHKEIKEVNGGHNGRRSAYLMDYISKFFLRHLKEKEIIKSDIPEEPKEEIGDFNIINQNLLNEIPKRYKKTIYEEWGIPNPNFKKEKPTEENKITENNNNEDNINIIINNDEIKNEIKNEIKEEKNEIKEEIKKEEKKEIKEEVKEEIKENKNDELNKNKNEINIKNNFTEEIKFAKNLTFYNTNKNFGSYIDEILNNTNDTNQNKEQKNEDELTNSTQNNQDNENNNMNINNYKKKTIYDDLNLRRKFK